MACLVFEGCRFALTPRYLLKPLRGELRGDRVRYLLPHGAFRPAANKKDLPVPFHHHDRRVVRGRCVAGVGAPVIDDGSNDGGGRAA